MVGEQEVDSVYVYKYDGMCVCEKYVCEGVQKPKKQASV